jgi:uncharacterized protein (DUF169 family)
MVKKEASAIDWARLSREMECLLRLKASPVAYKRLEKLEELDKIPGVIRLDRRASFCQVPALARTMDMTVAATRDNFGERCARINGLAPTTEKQVAWEANAFATGWFANVEEARKQMAEYPLVPPGEAVVLAPLASGKFYPDVILIYGNPAQMMLLMNGLQFKDLCRWLGSVLYHRQACPGYSLYGGKGVRCCYRGRAGYGAATENDGQGGGGAAST